jgi:hypothetical protein
VDCTVAKEKLKEQEVCCHDMVFLVADTGERALVADSGRLHLA